MTIPDFEIDVSLVARELVSHVPPDAKTETEGEGVRLARDHVRSGLPEEIQAGGRSTDVVVEKRLVGFKDAGESGVRSVRGGKRRRN